jgi:hypothetical protein
MWRHHSRLVTAAVPSAAATNDAAEVLAGTSDERAIGQLHRLYQSNTAVVFPVVCNCRCWLRLLVQQGVIAAGVSLRLQLPVCRAPELDAVCRVQQSSPDTTTTTTTTTTKLASVANAGCRPQQTM